jgi:hypothetical protein
MGTLVSLHPSKLMARVHTTPIQKDISLRRKWIDQSITKKMSLVRIPVGNQRYMAWVSPLYTARDQPETPRPAGNGDMLTLRQQPT